MDYVNAAILGIIEGLTEFLPVSSTGHMVIAMPLLGVRATAPPWNVLLWVSQFGAILAVILFFWRDLWRRTFHPPVRTWRAHVLTKLVVAMIPTVTLGLLLKRYLDPLEDLPIAVAAALIVGAGAIEYIDRRYRRQVPQELENVSLRQAFLIGAIQCVSMWPGISRAGASILGGMVLGLTPRVATEFSFYLAIPTMLAAAAKTLWSHRHELHANVMTVVVLGTALAFVTALLVVAGFMNYVRRYRFTPFAVYRVILGAVVLFLYGAGWSGFRPAQRVAADASPTICVQYSHAAGIANSGESSTSSTPPRPGSAWPESFAAASRLSSDAHKSPAVESKARTSPKTAKGTGPSHTACRAEIQPVARSASPAATAAIIPTTNPPKKPCQVFLGLSQAMSCVWPSRLPMAYAPTSVILTTKVESSRTAMPATPPTSMRSRVMKHPSPPV